MAHTCRTTLLVKRWLFSQNFGNFRLHNTQKIILCDLTHLRSDWTLFIWFKYNFIWTHFVRQIWSFMIRLPVVAPTKYRQLMSIMWKTTGIYFAVLSNKIRFVILHFMQTHLVWVSFLNFSMCNLALCGLNLIWYQITFCVSCQIISHGLNVVYTRCKMRDEIEPPKWFFTPWSFLFWFRTAWKMTEVSLIQNSWAFIDFHHIDQYI